MEQTSVVTKQTDSISVLLVEDDAGHAELIRRALEEASNGFELTVATTLQEAKELCNDRCYSITITDYRLPDGEGIELLTEGNGCCPVILLTAQGNEHLAVEAMKSGAADYLVKAPELFAAMPRIIKRALREWNLIQEKQRIAEAIHNAKHEWEDTFDAVPDLISLIDTNHRIMQVNKAMAQHCGKNREELIGRHCFGLIHGCSTPPEYCPHSKMIQCGSTQRIEIKEEILNKIFEITVSPLYHSNGQIRACVHVARDITERKKAEQEHEKLEEQLRHAQRMQSIGTLASGIAHDFNNIITAIIGYTHITQMSLPPEGQLQANLQQILDACSRASHLTRDLLLFSRKQPVDKKLINLHEVISKSETFLSRIIGENIKLNITTEHGREIFIQGDEHQLGQVFMNLSTNSRDAMPDGGAISVQIETVNVQEPQASAMGLPRAGSYACIHFSDTGSGIETEKLARIFDPFYTTKDPGKGTGLGLSIIYGIIKNHDGIIMAQSRAGEGTDMTIYLPEVTEQ